MTLAALMESDVSDVFLNTDEHAETFVFTPAGGASRTITAIVDEVGAPLVDGYAHQVRKRQIIVRCADDVTTGIARADVKNGAKATWDGVTWSNPIVLARNAGLIAIEFDSPVIETSGRQRRGGL